MPEEALFEMLESAMTEYKVTPSKEAKDKLGCACMLLATRFGTEGKDTFELAKEMDERRRIVKAHEFSKH